MGPKYICQAGRNLSSAYFNYHTTVSHKSVIKYQSYKLKADTFWALLLFWLLDWNDSLLSLIISYYHLIVLQYLWSTRIHASLHNLKNLHVVPPPPFLQDTE